MKKPPIEAHEIKSRFVEPLQLRYGKLNKKYLAAIMNWLREFCVAVSEDGELQTVDPVTDDLLRMQRGQVIDMVKEDRKRIGLKCSLSSIEAHFNAVYDMFLAAAKQGHLNFTWYDPNKVKEFSM